MLYHIHVGAVTSGEAEKTRLEGMGETKKKGRQSGAEPTSSMVV